MKKLVTACSMLMLITLITSCGGSGKKAATMVGTRVINRLVSDSDNDSYSPDSYDGDSYNVPFKGNNPTVIRVTNHNHCECCGCTGYSGYKINGQHTKCENCPHSFGIH